MPLAILRTRKVKSFKDLTLLEQHNDRARDTPNADTGRQHLNEVLTGDRRGDLADDVRARIDQAQSGLKVRSNAVLAIDVLMSASPDYFRPGEPERAGHYDPQRLKAWVEASMTWLKQRFGRDNVVRAEVHLDEATPHIHACVVPIDGRGKLNARAVIGGSKNVLRDMQTQYAGAVEHLGIERGLGGSRATHTEVAQFYAVVAQPAPELPDLATFTRKVITKQGLLSTETQDQQFVDPEHYRELRKKAKLAGAQAKEAKLLKLQVGELKKANSALSKTNETMKAQLAQYRQVPALDVLRRVYRAKATGRDQYEVIAERDGKPVAVPVLLDGEHHRVGGPRGKKSKSAVDLVCAIEGWEPSQESAKKAVDKLAAALSPGDCAQAYAMHCVPLLLEFGARRAEQAKDRQRLVLPVERGAGALALR